MNMTGVQLETWKLVCYNLSVGIYFIVIGIGYWLQGHKALTATNLKPEEGLISSLKPLVKVVPIILLAINVWLLVPPGSPDLAHYRTWIFWGLLASAGGDVFLVYDKYEIGGPLFALAHLCFIAAFGFGSSGGLPTAIVFFAVWFVGARAAEGGFGDDGGLLKRGVQLYALILCTMSWRATARFVDHRSLANLFCCVGSIFFVASDSLIAIHMIKEVKEHVSPFRRDLRVMLTYYIAQFCIEHSAVESDIPLFGFFG